MKFLPSMCIGQRLTAGFAASAERVTHTIPDMDNSTPAERRTGGSNRRCRRLAARP